MAKGNREKHDRSGNDMSQYVTIELLKEHFDVKDGKLFWSHRRPKSHFKTLNAYGKYLEVCAGREAGAANVSIGKYRQAYVMCLDGVKRLMYSHRILWCLYNDALIPKGMVVDHRDGSPENNGPENLRLVTPKVNARNRAIPAGVVSGAIKVVYDTETYYIAKMHGKRIDKVKYETAEEAGLARDRWIIAHGLESQFRLNFPELVAANANTQIQAKVS